MPGRSVTTTLARTDGVAYNDKTEWNKYNDNNERLASAGMRIQPWQKHIRTHTNNSKILFGISSRTNNKCKSSHALTLWLAGIFVVVVSLFSLSFIHSILFLIVFISMYAVVVFIACIFFLLLLLLLLVVVVVMMVLILKYTRSISCLYYTYMQSNFMKRGEYRTNEQKERYARRNSLFTHGQLIFLFAFFRAKCFLFFLSRL